MFTRAPRQELEHTAAMIHDVLKTTLPSRNALKSSGGSRELLRFGVFMGPVCVPSLCLLFFFFFGDSRNSISTKRLHLERSKEAWAFLLIMFFVLSLRCEIRRSVRVGGNYLQLANVIFLEMSFSFK